MNYFQSLILSAVEGITEFLPISSTGHLILASNLLRISQTSFIKDFEIIIQLGAILAVLVLYFKTLYNNINLWKKIITAFLPTAIIGFILFKFIKSFLLGNLYITLISMFLGGVFLIAIELVYKEKDHHADKIEKISYRNAFLIGICQSIAVIPGVSRSAATIIGALLLGTKRKAATEFSFLLALPTLLAATGLDIIKSNFSYSTNEWSLLLVGFLGSFVVAFVVIKWFLEYIKNHNFIAFGIYRIILSLVFYLILIR